jgi:hypothetical protein
LRSHQKKRAAPASEAAFVVYLLKEPLEVSSCAAACSANNALSASPNGKST